MRHPLKISLTAMTFLTLAGCANSASEEASSVATPKNVYVSSGVCNSGPGVVSYTSATASRSVTKWNADTGIYVGKILDWNTASGFANSSPQQVIKSGSNIYILGENGTTFTERKIYSVKSTDIGNYQTVVPSTASATPAAAASHINRTFAIDSTGMITVNRTVSIEKFNPLGAIIPSPNAATSYINPAAATAPCFPAAAFPTGTVTAGGTYTGISDIALLDPGFGKSSGKTLFAYMGSAAANNRIGAVKADGLTSGTVAHCAGGVQISSVTHNVAPNLCPQGGCTVSFDTSGVSPTAMVFIKTPAPATTTGKLIVTYAPSNTAATAQNNSTNLNHAIVMWDITEVDINTVTFTSPVVLYNDDQVIIAPSAIAYNADSSSIYVAVGPASRTGTQSNGQGYNIEKFTLDISTPKLTRVTDSSFRPFIVGNSETKCISGITIAD